MRVIVNKKYELIQVMGDLYMEDLTLVLMFNAFVKELGKHDKMRDLPSILSLFCNKFNKFNYRYTGAGMLDSICHMTLKSF